MTNSAANIPEYIRQNLSMEATFQNNDNTDTYNYGYITYDKTKLKGPRIDKIKNCNIQANGRIPITENEFLDMALNTDKDNKISDFHMTYIRTFDGKEDIFFGKKYSHPLKALSIRTDIGPHIGSPHIDVELSDINKEKVVDKKVWQDEEFTNYESAISAVFMQVEKLSNPLIGAQYWLSPVEIFSERVKKLAERREQHKISTPLSVVSRAINVQAYEQTRDGLILPETQFWNIVESQIQFIREKEKQLGGYLDVAGEVHYSTEMSKLPFLFFAPENAEYSFRTYYSDGSEIQTKGGLSGVVWEKNNGINFIRDLNSEEKKSSNSILTN